MRDLTFDRVDEWLDRKTDKRVERRLKKALATHPRVVGGGTMLTESVVVFDSRGLSDFAMRTGDAESLGQEVSVPGASRWRDRARYELRGPDGRCILAVLVARRSRAHLILDPEGTEIARLQKPGRLPRRRRTVVAAGRPVGRIVTRWRRIGYPFRSVQDLQGNELARVVRLVFGDWVLIEEAATRVAYAVIIDGQPHPALRAAALAIPSIAQA